MMCFSECISALKWQVITLLKALYGKKVACMNTTRGPWSFTRELSLNKRTIPLLLGGYRIEDIILWKKISPHPDNLPCSMGLQVNSSIWGAFFQSLVSAINCVVRFSILSERIHLNHLNLHAPNNVQMLKSYSLFFSYAILIQSWVSPLVIPHNRTNESLGTSLLTVFSVKG